MTSPTYDTAWPTYTVLFSEGDYSIVRNEGFSINLVRDSVIIHKCPERDVVTPHHITITQLNQYGNACYYCKQTVPESVQALYQLQNMDYFDMDVDEYQTRTNVYTSPFKNTNDYS